jgi:hypothetical protein
MQSKFLLSSLVFVVLIIILIGWLINLSENLRTGEKEDTFTGILKEGFLKIKELFKNLKQMIKNQNIDNNTILNKEEITNLKEKVLEQYERIQKSEE